ncbi:MAG: FAD-binding protein, partial [Bacteroidia bacterium]
TDTVNIIGAGIGGLTTAITLKQKGLNVHIFESASAINSIGEALSKICTFKPFCFNVMAVVSPPIPAPIIFTVSVGVFDIFIF